jgi:hypothetical protein
VAWGFFTIWHSSILLIESFTPAMVSMNFHQIIMGEKHFAADRFHCNSRSGK